MEKSPKRLSDLVSQEKPDLLSLMEHKLQESHVPDMTEKLAKLLPNYEAHWTCSTAKKGYSGVVTLVKKNCKMPVKKVSFGIGAADDEGRVTTVDFGKVAVVSVYVPNSGQTLQRLDWRLATWDKKLREYTLSRFDS